MCIITTLNNGLRNGGGIGDVLRKPSSTVNIMIYYFSNNYPYYIIKMVFRSHCLCLESFMTCSSFSLL
jgi:hypothetical protein